MKRNILLSLCIILVCISLFSVLILSTVNAENIDHQISLTNKTYSIGKIEESTSFTKINLNIIITLNNTNNISADMTVAIWDSVDKTPIRSNAIIPPGQSKAFLFSSDNFFVIGKGEHSINISYYPTNESIIKSSSNSGVDVLIVQAGSSGPGKSTPGFELIILVGALFITGLLHKKKKK